MPPRKQSTCGKPHKCFTLPLPFTQVTGISNEEGNKPPPPPVDSEPPPRPLPNVVPMDTYDPKPPPKFSLRILTTLPKGLRDLGNQKQWTFVLNHLQDPRRRCRPLVLWGPTGCGKTYGVRELLSAIGYHVVELDGTDGEDARQLVSWVKRVRDIQVLRGPTAVVLDDFESLTDEGRKAMGTMLKKTTDDVGLAPFFITCTQWKEPRMRTLQGLANVRLFAPNEHVCKEWFDTYGFLLLTNDTGSFKCVRCYPKPGWTVRHQQHLVSGDLRRVTIALQWEALTKRVLTAKVATVVAFQNSFHATQQLLLRKTSATRWASAAKPHDADLLREHLPKYVGEDIDLLSDALDYLSMCDVLAPSRFECSSAQIPFTMEVLGRATRRFSRARDVGALFPPARPTPTWGHTRGSPSEMDRRRPWTTREKIDVPTPLHDRQ